MTEYIERSALLDELCRDNCERRYDGTCHNCRMTDTIADFPAADVAPVRRGRWIPSDYTGDCCYTCSECGFERDAYLLDIGNFCPNCGALMGEKEDEHEVD